jgi:hypothetical protein
MPRCGVWPSGKKTPSEAGRVGQVVFSKFMIHIFSTREALRFFCHLAVAGAVAIGSPEPAVGAESSNENAAPDWKHIKETAQAFVERESPPEVWPFAFSPSGDHRSDQKVFAHYFSPFPLSFDNKPAAEDTYRRVHLSPEGSDAKLAGRGGYKPGGGGALRQRPLPVGPWESPDWKKINLAIEVLRAQKIGLDGFAYDMLGVSPGNEHRQILENLLAVTEQVAPDFKIVLMPDMNAELKKKPEILEEVIFDLAKSPALYRLEDGRILVSPYSAQQQPVEYWQTLMRNLESRGVRIALLPVFVGYEHLDKNGAAFGPISYGLSDWGFRDIAFAKEYDFARSAARARVYSPLWMMPVAPQDVRAKALIAWESENTECFRYLWEAARDGGSQFVHLVTWNDYSEASEISPSSSTRYVFYDLSAFFTAWFRTGRMPEIKQDAIYYTHRSQIFPFPDGVTAGKQREPFKQAGRTPFRNHVEMVALLTAPAVLEIEQGGEVVRKEAPAGLATFSAPLREGRPALRIRRDGRVVREVVSDWEAKQGGDVEDPVYHGGSSTREFSDSSQGVSSQGAPEK